MTKIICGLFSHYDFCDVKKTISVILLLIFSLQTFYSASVTLWFYVNQDTLSKKYCVNKYRPEMHCNGKCYLSKKIKAAEEKQEQQTPFQLKQWVETSPCTVSYIYYSLTISTEMQVLNPREINLYNFISLQPVFHPPSAI